MLAPIIMLTKPGGALNVHLDYIPSFQSGHKAGLSVQNNLSALKALRLETTHKRYGAKMEVAESRLSNMVAAAGLKPADVYGVSNERKGLIRLLLKKETRLTELSKQVNASRNRHFFI